MKSRKNFLELLSDPRHYVLFERCILERGWISDFDLTGIRDVERVHLDYSELLGLAHAHGRTSNIADADLYMTELLCEGPGSLCFMFDRRIIKI